MRGADVCGVCVVDDRGDAMNECGITLVQIATFSALVSMATSGIGILAVLLWRTR